MFGFLQLELPFFGAMRNQPSGAGPVLAPPEERREISLHGQTVAYAVRRSARRRTLGLTIDTRGLRVAAPLKAKQADIERLIVANAQWVLAKLKEWQSAEHAGARAWSFADPLPFLGVARVLKVAPGKTGLHVFDDCLILTVPRPQDQSGARSRLADLIKDYARQHFSARLAHFSAGLADT